jgi:hypothetical protein
MHDHMRPSLPAQPPTPPRPRVAPFTYNAGGKKLHVREANGHLLVRTGGGYEELLTALAKLPWGGPTPGRGGAHGAGRVAAARAAAAAAGPLSSAGCSDAADGGAAGAGGDGCE